MTTGQQKFAGLTSKHSIAATTIARLENESLRSGMNLERASIPPTIYAHQRSFMVDPITQAARHRRGLPTGRFSSRTLALDIETQTLVLGVQEHRVGAVEDLYIRTIHEEQYTNVCQFFDTLVERGADSRL